MQGHQGGIVVTVVGAVPLQDRLLKNWSPQVSPVDMVDVTTLNVGCLMNQLRESQFLQPCGDTIAAVGLGTQVEVSSYDGWPIPPDPLLQ